MIERIHFNTTIKVQYSNAQYSLTICTDKYHMCWTYVFTTPLGSTNISPETRERDKWPCAPKISW